MLGLQVFELKTWSKADIGLTQLHQEVGIISGHFLVRTSQVVHKTSNFRVKSESEDSEKLP